MFLSREIDIKLCQIYTKIYIVAEKSFDGNGGVAGILSTDECLTVYLDTFRISLS